ncbi:MAG: permease of phosphate ABC transporter [Oscillospiraceae bacterium]|nr:permease of phosphate ABC transporter [Oscillospiraceae bacterium]MBO7372789.1 permease of phosphate ABC transporter [Oscillospiraceae bacterium]MBP5239483.1 permease of phosphate ABC transporter [Oscillospiraceae bacterium]MBP5744510.1 permease of phosphate ABC transporter [Oscillospiraceae bacterium]
MKKLFAAADRYLETSDWKIIAVLKFCLISLGMMIGMQIKPKYKKNIFLGSLGVFAVTYIPLMAKFFRVFTGKE